MSQDRLLNKLYYQLGNSGSFQGANVLFLSAKRIDPSISRKYVQNWLNQQKIYLMHKHPRKPKGRAHQYNKYVVTNKNLDFSCDTMHISHSKLPYVLVCRDQFTGRLFANPQRNLKAAVTKKSFEKIIKDQNKSIYPVTVFSDRGNEFKLFKHLPIGSHKTTSKNPVAKSYLAEKSISLIRNKLAKYSTFIGRKVDISDVIDKILYSVNHTPSVVTGLSPVEASDPSVAGIVFERRYGNYFKKKSIDLANPVFKIGSFVRVAIPDSHMFMKRSKPGFSEEIFMVINLRDTYPVTYKVIDSNGELVEGFFHAKDLIKVERFVDNE